MTYVGEQPARYRVFIVDDHPLIRKVLAHALTCQPDLEVVGVAASAEEALEALAALSPHLALVDYSLPGMNGVDLIRQLRRTHPDTCSVMCSSHHEPFYIDAALGAGACGYVVKGEPDALLQAISNVLAGHTTVQKGLN